MKRNKPLDPCCSTKHQVYEEAHMTHISKEESHETIVVSYEKPICFVTLNRPLKGNAYNDEMLQKFKNCFDDFSKNPELFILVVTGRGKKAFCTGADLNEIHSRNYQEGLHLLSADFFRELSRCPKITMAAINGAAMGGGLELALSCDLRVCTSNAKFSFPETGIGLIPAAGGVERLPQIMGSGKAKELILGGLTWNAVDAHRFGLVSHIFQPEELIPEVRKWAVSISQKNQLALSLAKNAINQDVGWGPAYPLSRLTQALLYELKQDK